MKKTLDCCGCVVEPCGEHVSDELSSGFGFAADFNFRGLVSQGKSKITPLYVGFVIS
jgi:hypothetical protein